MKILMVSMFSNHFFRWTEQLKDSGHEVHWIDVFDSNTYMKEISFVNQIIGWRNKIKYPGRYFIKKNLPSLNEFIDRFNKRDLGSFVEQSIIEIRPDIIHSFVLQSAAYPILEIMKKYPEIKWVYSAWGNDLYYRQQNEIDLRKIMEVLPQFDFMFADCKRDYEIALRYGFKGKYLGTFPTGGGYQLRIYESFIKSFEEKNIILIKGYEGKLGRCNKILEAIASLKILLSDYIIVVFGANEQVVKFYKNTDLINWDNFEIKKQITQNEVLKLMGKAYLYLGNSISDGMPNTLLEALIMGAYPIQSNPGGATEEIIKNGVNGLLIENPEDVNEIKNLITQAIKNKKNLKNGVEYNFKFIKPNLERKYIQTQVLEKYKFIAYQLNSGK